MKKFYFSILFCLLINHVIGQNNIKRIDSLTHAFMSNTNSKPLIRLDNQKILNFSKEEFDYYADMIGSTIDYQYNEFVKTQISYMLNPNSSFLSKACARKDQYFSVFEEILDRKNMPLEIKYLSIVESLLSPNAVSWCGATGLWQFMPATGRMMDLEINNEVDERKDIFKSTEKACDYLLSMYKNYGDWLLALAAYNGGPGNVNKAIRNSGGKKTFWEIKPYLPKETQNYVPKFIATAFLMNFAPPNNEETNKIESHELLVPVNMCCPVDMDHVIAFVDVNPYELTEWNSTYKTGYIPSSMQCKSITLSYSKAMKLAENQDSIYKIADNLFNANNFIKKESIVTYYRVKKGETIQQVADKNNVSVAELKKWNHIKKIKANQNLKIIRYKETTLPIVNKNNHSHFYYITKTDSETINSICSKFTEIDIEKTRLLNDISTLDTPISKSKLIVIHLKNSTN